MRVKMKTAEPESKPLDDLLRIIRFTEGVSAKLHRVRDEARIYQVVREEFAKSKRYAASILLLADDGASLSIAETSITPSRLKVLEGLVGLQAKGYKIKLNKSAIYRRVVREKKTIQASVSETIRQFLPRSLAYLVSKTMGYENKLSILTPLYRDGEVMGVLAMSSSELSEHFIPSVENLARHISTAVELASEHAQREGAMQLLKGYKDHLRELVEECTSELETANKKLQEDITERKQAEAALRESEERFRSVVENSQAAIIIIDSAYRFLYVNPEACRISGYSRKELIGRDFRQVLDEESQKLVAERYLRRQSGEEVPPRYEFNIIRKDGEKRRMEISSAVIKDSAGEVRTVAQLLDITERKQTEAALRQSREELRKMFESVTDGISVIDLNGIVIETNQRTVEIHGYKSKDELVGRRALELIAPGDHEKVATNMRKALKEGTVRGVEYTLLRADGSEFPGELSTSVLRDASGRWVGHITIARDITERKEAEEKEKKLQQELYLARRLAAIGELAAGVAHEINNPLTGILGFSQRLLRKNPNEEFSRGLEIIHTEARRTAEVVQNLLTFARRREPRKEYSDINDIVQKALELRAYALQTSNIEVVTVLAPTLPQLMVDFPQIQEVFLNIILNAEQAISETYGKGKLIIKTRQVKDCVRISFADDGPGIHPEHLDKVFDPFFTTRAERGGTGLGLSACHGIVTEHGGRIYARSTAGRGATFFVELPLSPVETPLVR